MSTGPGGYMCALCGLWVAYGGWHQCPGARPQPAPIINYYPAWWPAPLTEERVREIVREEIAAKDTEPPDPGMPERT